MLNGGTLIVRRRIRTIFKEFYSRDASTSHPSIQLIPSKVYIMQMKISEFRCRPVRSASRIHSKQNLKEKEDTVALSPLSVL